MLDAGCWMRLGTPAAKAMKYDIGAADSADAWIRLIFLSTMPETREIHELCVSSYMDNSNSRHRCTVCCSDPRMSSQIPFSSGPTFTARSIRPRMAGWEGSRLLAYETDVEPLVEPGCAIRSRIRFEALHNVGLLSNVTFVAVSETSRTRRVVDLSQSSGSIGGKGPALCFDNANERCGLRRTVEIQSISTTYPV